MIQDRESTEARFFDEYDRMKLDLAEAQKKVMLLTDQLRSAYAENQGLAYKVDFLTAEVLRVTASREQYERVAIRVSAKMEGGSVIEVSEAWTTQTCSCCGSRDSSERPKGIAGLGIREWDCDDCGTVHDRDVNAARNILRSGLATLVGGISC
jgi:hypothetical protein